MKYLKTTLLALSVVFVAIACDKTPTAPTNSIALHTPSLSVAAGPAPVDLHSAANFVILSQSGITDVSPSDITGNIGTYPISGTAIGVPCTEVTGTIYERDAGYTVGTCTNVVTDASLLTTAVHDMQNAYTNAAGRAHGVGPNLNLGGGTVSTNTLAPGTYTWTSNVSITGDITLSGGANDVYIFQVAGTLDMASGKSIILGNVDAKNVFWQVSGAVTLGTTSNFAGTILAQTNIAMQTGATLNGQALAQTAVTLEQNTVTTPIPFSTKGLKSIKVSINHVAQGDIGTCNNVWANDTFDKAYTIMANGYGTYNVNVQYNGGKFVTLAGKSPGACESGVDNGHTVAAGIKGSMKQMYNGTVIGTLIPGAKCSPSVCVNTQTILDTLFNPGWSWVGGVDNHWTWNNSYDAGSHGKWFDTSVSWPLNDTGDIN
jgi:hypothetical protein